MDGHPGETWRISWSPTSKLLRVGLSICIFSGEFFTKFSRVCDSYRVGGLSTSLAFSAATFPADPPADQRLLVLSHPKHQTLRSLRDPTPWPSFLPGGLCHFQSVSVSLGLL